MIEFQDWGPIEYEKALEKQEQLVEKVAAEKSEGVLVFCTHPPIVTLGRKTEAGDVFAWQGPIKEISRGGRATYHGPSQLVIYPIINLDLPTNNRPQRDIGWYLRTLENAIIDVLKTEGITAIGKSLQKKSQTDSGTEETGVWVGNQKIASLGIGVRKWVTYHGAALNVDEDPQAFQGMKPCGFSTETMVSMEKLLGRKVDRPKIQNLLKEKLLEKF
ncbi:MAG: hypothetical protein BroJett040_20150 [Oligoflexia bacterium]|nr:MAG: hypothetical protein BroJett040_20150 [Oligoflexia bacterium]